MGIGQRVEEQIVRYAEGEVIGITDIILYLIQYTRNLH